MQANVEVWEFDPSCELGEVAKLASERLAPPSFTGCTLSSRDDVLTVQVMAGAPSRDARSLYYVAGRGAFVLARREVWPPAAGCAEQRILVTLVAARQPSSAVAPP